MNAALNLRVPYAMELVRMISLYYVKQYVAEPGHKPTRRNYFEMKI